MILPGPLPDHHRADLTAGQVWDDYLAAITTHIAHHPRSLQVRLGPSELGDPCARKLGYKLLQVPPTRVLPPNWKATIGTAAHAWAEQAFDADNLRRAAALDGTERWLIEAELTVGYVPGYGFVTGHSDLYDRVSSFNLDHKFIGPAMLTKYRREGPSTTYKAQAHLYGQGWQLAGYPIREVGIAFMPRHGELADGFLWSEPYNPSAAAWALERLAGLWAATQAAGTAALAALPIAESYCPTCPWFRPGSTDPATGCPAPDDAPANTPAPAPLTFGA